MIIKNLKNMDNQETVNKFANAITWEKCDMLLTLNAEAMKKQENIIYPIGFNRNNCCMCMAWRTYAAVSCI